MSEENKVEELETRVESNDDPTYEELSKAFDEFMETAPVKVEETEVVENVEEKIPEPKIDTTDEKNLLHQENSRLGRKVARLEELIDRLSSNMLTKSDLDLVRNLNTTTTESEEEIQDITNVNELTSFMDKYLSKKKTEEEIKIKREKETYQNTYLDSMKILLSEVDDDNTRKLIYDKMINDEKYNVKISNNASLDASRNFNRVLKDLSSFNKSRFDNKRGTELATGVNVPGIQKPSTKSKIKLEDDAAQLARDLGLSEEEIEETLSKEISPSLRIH